MRIKYKLILINQFNERFYYSSKNFLELEKQYCKFKYFDLRDNRNNCYEFEIYKIF